MATSLKSSLIEVITQLNNLTQDEPDPYRRMKVPSQKELRELVELINLSWDRFQQLNMDIILNNSLLNETTETLAGLFDQTQALETALRTLKEKTYVEIGSVYLINEFGKLELQASFPDKPDLMAHLKQTIDIGEGIPGKAAEERRILYIKDTNTSEVKPSMKWDTKAVIAIPLLDDQDILGVMLFSGRTEQVKFDSTDEEFAETMARMTVVATKNIRMVRQIEDYSHTLEEKVEERTAAIKDLMDNTGQGFFTFDKNFKVHPEYSKACVTFFGKSIENLDALELMFAEEADSHREVINMLFNGVSDLDILGDVLPHEITLNDQIIALAYSLITTNQEQKIMMILTNVTVERALATKIATEEERNAMIVKVALERDGFIHFLHELEGLFFSIHTLLNKTPAKKIDTNELFRLFHSIKGGSATYSLKSVAEKTHAIESRLAEIRSRKEPLNSDLVQLLADETVEAQHLLEEALEQLSGIISPEDRYQSEPIYRIKKSKISSLKDLLAKQLPKKVWKSVQGEINQLIKQPMGPILQKWALAAEGLADRLDKSIQVEIHGKNVEVYYEPLETFFEVFIHLIRNCVDHGIEETEIRMMLGKPEMGNLSIEAYDESGLLCLKVSDDGSGINPETIKTHALQNQLITPKFAKTASAEELVNLIFMPGLSTKETVSDVSGRGVGMDAVKTTLHHLNGKIQVKTELDKGTTFEITIPHVI